MSDPELEAFKRADFRVLAEGFGYVLDRRESSRNSAVMRHANGDKIIIKMDSDGHHVYFSVRDDRDNGSIIDFVQRRSGLSLGAVRKELRSRLAAPSISQPPYPALSTTTKDRLRVEAEFSKMHDVRQHPYLQRERCVPSALLSSSRFAGCVRADERANAIFPHFDDEGLCGYEMKNDGFTGFATGGSKGLWLSRSMATDDRLVFCESAIDALSYATLFPDTRTRYASIAGKLNRQQPELIRAAAVLLPTGSEVVAATDADAAGCKLADEVRQAVELTGRNDLRFRVHQPLGFKDWNDQLRGRVLTQPPIYRGEGPSIG